MQSKFAFIFFEIFTGFKTCVSSQVVAENSGSEKGKKREQQQQQQKQTPNKAKERTEEKKFEWKKS